MADQIQDAAFDAAAAARRVAERDAQLASITDPTLLHLIAHFERADVIPADALAAATIDSRLGDDEFQAALEACPVGFTLTRDASNRWTATVTSHRLRVGHGGTAREAVESFILGAIASTIADAQAKALDRLPATVRAEVQERDAAVAQGLDPVAVAKARQAAAAPQDDTPRASIFDITPPATAAASSDDSSDKGMSDEEYEERSATDEADAPTTTTSTPPSTPTPTGSPIPDGGTEGAGAPEPETPAAQ